MAAGVFVDAAGAEEAEEAAASEVVAAVMIRALLSELFPWEHFLIPAKKISC